MSKSITVQAWVANVRKKADGGRARRPRAGYSGSPNGNISGIFAAAVVLTAGEQEFEIPEGTEFCVYGPMGGDGTAASIFDQENGQLTIKADGRVLRGRPHPVRVASRPRVRMSVPLGIG